MLFTKATKKQAFSFWKEKVRARIQDPLLQKILAPETQPQASSVSLIEVKSTPVVQVVEQEIQTTEKVWEFDDVVCVTGSYAVTGDLLQMNIQSKDGQLLIDKGKDEIETYLGMTVSGF